MGAIDDITESARCGRFERPLPPESAAVADDLKWLIRAMTDDKRGTRSRTDAVGLCGTCQHVKRVDSAKGSRFYLCRLSETDPRFRRYPPLPVLRCGGYSPDPSAADVDNLARRE